MSATELQALLRFFSQEAKVPLATAMGKVKDLQSANLDSPEKIAKAKIEDIRVIFSDEKVAKQILASAKRVAKKRVAGGDTAPSPRKKKKESLFAEDATSPAEIEASLELPSSASDEDELSNTVLFSNRAPLALAFVFTLLKYTMPEQPLSSRLSLAQGYIGVTSRARAVYLGLESGKSAGEEGYGKGHSTVNITGKEITVLKRWGYEWKKQQASNEQATQGTLQAESQDSDQERDAENETDAANNGIQVEDQPPLWALDLEALKKSNRHEQPVISNQKYSGSNSTLPIHTPQAARAYLLKAFNTPPEIGGQNHGTTKKPSAAAKVAENERNLGKLLTALGMLYESWAVTLSPEELDKRTWNWYVRVRPQVADGAAGWGGKNTLKLADILVMRRGV